MKLNRIAALPVVAALVVGAVAAATAGALGAARGGTDPATTQATIAALQKEVAALRADDPDWAAVAAAVEPSVVTVLTDEDLGSGWVVQSGSFGSHIVTNYHVVADAVDHHEHDFRVIRGDRTLSADLLTVDRVDDLAVLRVSEKLPALKTSARRADVGTPVMAAGSPLGLKASVSVGVVAAYRSLFGSDYLQFTAAISPGSSGGPVVDGSGRVVGIATAKIVDDNADSLALAIPVQVACATIAECVQA